ncbi:MAG: 2OG-Fe(II) oxygenase [Hyphomicrobiaceae bacterium]|nr:MAG: 2OG-Fe(II) oxygenase [Hyphomicrobiaceae bacterium]
MINLDAISKADVNREPFQFFAAGEVLPAEDLAAIRHDFPAIEKPGIFPLSTLKFGPAFGKLIEEIQSPALAKVVGAKFGVDLSGLPLMITVRGRAQAKDGRIHTDTKDKVVTCLLYLNERWDEGGGRLRMLRGPDDLENYVAEIPPNGGTFAAFKVSDNSYHGHKPFVGDRRYVMFNWVRSEAALNRQINRHKLSASIKKLIPFFYRGK